MGANHKGSPRVLDALAKCWDAEDTSSWTAATKTPAGASDEADMGLLGYDEGDNGAWVTRWPGINSAGSATIQFILQDSADGVTYAACLTTAAVAFDGTGVFDPATAEIPVPEMVAIVEEDLLPDLPARPSEEPSELAFVGDSGRFGVTAA